MADMEIVRMFNSELSSLYEGKPPISKAKMTAITKYAVKAVKYYKHIVHSVEKFVQKCRAEYKVPGLYVIDSIVRQSRHQFGRDKDLFGPRFAKNIKNTFVHFYSCPSDEKPKIVRVLNLWQKNGVYPPEIVQPLIDMASSGRSHSTDFNASPPEDLDDPEPAKSNMNNDYLNVLEQQRQQQESQIQQLKNQLEQQQQQQQLLQQQLQMQLLQQQKQQQYQQPNLLQQQQQPQVQNVPQSIAAPVARVQPDIQPEIQQGARQMQQPLIQSQPRDNRNLQGPESFGAAQFMEKFQRMMQSNAAQEQPQASHVTDRINNNPLPAEKGKSPGFNQALLDAFDYGDDENDEQRLAEQRRHLMEEESRLVKSLKESPKYDSKVAGILQKLQENVKMQKSQALQEEMYQARSGIEDARLIGSHHVKREDSQETTGTNLPFLGEHPVHASNNNWQREHAHPADVRDDPRASFMRMDDREGDRRRNHDYMNESANASRGSGHFDYRREVERDEREHHRERGFREWDSREFRDNDTKERERREREAREREIREREIREREIREMEIRDREMREREARERETRERETREREVRERETREREIREREEREREIKEKEAREKEAKEREAKEREAREREIRERERREREHRDRERRSRDGGRARQVDAGRGNENARKETCSEPQQSGRKQLSVEERYKLGFPDIKKGRLSLCSLTVWVGHLPPRTTPEQLKETFEEFGEVESIDLVQARGCSFIVMKNRRDADLSIKQLRNRRFFNHTIRMAWAPGKAIKGSDFKQFWDEDKGVTYIPWDRIRGKSLKDLLDGGVIDPDSLPPGMELDVEKEEPPSSEVPVQIPPPTMIGPPPVMTIPPPGLMPFPPGFAPPMPGMPMPGMMPNFAMGMPPPPGPRLPPQGMPPGFAPQFNENMPPRSSFDPSQRHQRPPLLEAPPNHAGEFGPNQHGPRQIWEDPAARFPGPRGPRGFMRPSFEERPPWMQQHRPRFPMEQNQSRDLPTEQSHEMPKEDETKAIKQDEETGIPTESQSWRNSQNTDTPIKDENVDSDKKDEETRSKESMESRPGDKRRDRDDRERSRDRNRDWDRGRNRDRDGRGDRGRDRDRDRDWDRRRFSGRDRDFGRDRDRDADRDNRDRGRDRDYDRDRRYADRGRDRYRSRDRSRDRNRSRDRDRSRGKDREQDSDRDRDRDRDSDRDRESDRSRSSRDRDHSASGKKTDETFDEPDVKRVKREDSASGTAADNVDVSVKQEAKNGDGDDDDKDDKGGWKKLDQSSSDSSKEQKPTDDSTKPLMQQGFGFVAPPMKYGSLKPGVQLAAKPSLFDEEKKPEKKIDMFSADSDDEMKDGENKQTSKENNESTIKDNAVPLESSETVHNELTEVFQAELENGKSEKINTESADSKNDSPNISDNADGNVGELHKDTQIVKSDAANDEEESKSKESVDLFDKTEFSQADSEKTETCKGGIDEAKVSDDGAESGGVNQGVVEELADNRDDIEKIEAYQNEDEKTVAEQHAVERLEIRQDDAEVVEAGQGGAAGIEASQGDDERVEACQGDAQETEATDGISGVYRDDAEMAKSETGNAEKTVDKIDTDQDNSIAIEAVQEDEKETVECSIDTMSSEACQDDAENRNVEPEGTAVGEDDAKQKDVCDEADTDIAAAKED